MSYPAPDECWGEFETRLFAWLRGSDSNRQPPGYEPDELPVAPPRMFEKHYSNLQGVSQAFTSYYNTAR